MLHQILRRLQLYIFVTGLPYLQGPYVMGPALPPGAVRDGGCLTARGRT